MNKITFLGAGSTVFAKNVLGDCMMTESIPVPHIGSISPYKIAPGLQKSGGYFEPLILKE